MLAPRLFRRAGTPRRVLFILALFAGCAYAPRAVAQAGQAPVRVQAAQAPARTQAQAAQAPAQTEAQAAQAPARTEAPPAARTDDASAMRLTGQKFRVRVSTRPPGGTVAVVDALTYRQHLALEAKKKTRGEMPWRTLVQAREDLIGRYHYRVKWDSGKNEEGEFSVMNPEDVTLPSR